MNADATPPQLEQRGPVAILRLNRPARHNRIEPEDVELLDRYLDTLEQSPDCRVLILTGQGISFSSGYDLNRLAEDPAADPLVFARMIDRLEDLPKPTIAALNGSVYGGAIDLALACDFRIGVEGMQLRMPAAQLGIGYYASGLRRYVSRLGLAAAKQLFLTAATVDSDTLLRIGYLDARVSAERLLPEALALAEQLAGNAPEAMGHLKRGMNLVASDRADPLELDETFRRSLHSEEARAARRAWLARSK